MRKLFYFALIVLPLVTTPEKDSNLKERLGAKLEVETSVIEATTASQMESDWISVDRGSHNKADGNASSKTRKHQKLPVGYFNTCNKTPTPGEDDDR